MDADALKKLNKNKKLVKKLGEQKFTGVFLVLNHSKFRRNNLDLDIFSTGLLQ